MARSVGNPQLTRESAESVEEQIARIATMSIGELRATWREVYGSEPPPAFSKDLLARALAYRLQEQAYGGLSAATTRLLRSLAKPGAEPPRRVKIGSVIVREHKGVLHEVMIVPGGFCWRGETYDSLSTIARKITGVSWNGPRFFGLRARKDTEAGPVSSDGSEAASLSKETQRSSKPSREGSPRNEESANRAGRRSSIRTGGRR
jgi:hypothetical protein